MEAAVGLLKSMEKYCTPLVSHIARFAIFNSLVLFFLQWLFVSQEYSAFCYCLTLERLTDNPAFADWTVSRGRLECFDAIQGLIDGKDSLIEPLRSSGATNASSFLDLVGSGLQHLYDHAVTSIGHPSRVAHWAMEEGLVLHHMPRHSNSSNIPVMHVVSNDEELSPDLRPPASSAPVSERPSSRNSGRLNKRNTEESVQLLDSFGLIADNKPIDKVIDDRFKDIKSSSELTRNERFRDLSGRPPATIAPATPPKPVPEVPNAPVPQLPRQPPVAWVVGTDPEPPTTVQDLSKDNIQNLTPPVRNPTISAPSAASSIMPAVETKMGNSDPSMNDEATQVSVSSNRSGVTTVDRRIPAPHKHQPLANAPPTKAISKQPIIIFETPNCPLRSISIVSSELDFQASRRGGNKEKVILGIGSNGKKIHLLQYDLPLDKAGLGSVTPINEFLDVHKGSVYATDWYCNRDDMLGGGILASGSNDKLIRVLRLAIPE
jgi:hypothetical protein